MHFQPLAFGLLLSAFATQVNCAIDPQLYALFRRYTLYSAAAYADACPTPPNNATVVSYVNNLATDTQATIFRSDIDQEIVVAFRGTSTITDFGTDGNNPLVPYNSPGVSCSDCRVHNGTLVAWNSVNSPVVAGLAAQRQAHPNYNITVTGHSLGGALASIASPSLIGQGYNVTTYTLGQYRTGDPAYANYVDQVMPQPRMYRITHTNDGVPQTLTTAKGFHHHSTEYWETDPIGANTTRQCDGQEPADCNNSQPGIGIGNDGRGINPAHLCYTHVAIGNPLDRGAAACNPVSLFPLNC